MPSLQLQSGSANKNRHSTGGMISGSSQKWNQQAQRPHSIVVVKAAADPVTLEKDPDLVRLQVKLSLPYMHQFEFLEKMVSYVICPHLNRMFRCSYPSCVVL